MINSSAKRRKLHFRRMYHDQQLSVYVKRMTDGNDKCTYIIYAETNACCHEITIFFSLKVKDEHISFRFIALSPYYICTTKNREGI